MQRLFDYCDWVERNPSQTCDYVKLAVKRFRRDWRMKDEPTFPFRFDVEKAQAIVSFTEMMKQYKDVFAGQTLRLEPWQVFIFANVFGWVRKDNGRRRFRKAFIFVARKNGKSTMLSSVLLWDALSTAGAEGYCAATKRDQAKIVYESVVQMISQNAELKDYFQVYNSTSTIVCRSNASKISALSSDSKRFDGLNPSCVVFDEVAAMPDYSTIQILQSGTGSRPEPLLFEITSGSDDMNSAGHQEFERSEKILQGSIEDDSYFCILFTLDKKDRWQDRSVWIKANPNLDVSVRRDTLEKLCVEAEQNPGLEAEFRIKNLCQFISPVTVWIPYQHWQKCEVNGNRLKMSDVSKCYCVGAIDLSKRSDFTSYVLYFYDWTQDKFFARHRFYIPKEQIEAKCHGDSPLIRKWIEMGYITATEGAIVDYNVMFNDIKDDLKAYGVREILYDPWNAATLMSEIGPLVDLVEVQQSMKNLSPWSKDWEAAVIGGKIADNNPVMKWMVSNCDVYRDPNDNIKPVKHGGKSATSTHIDGVVTSVMALGRIRSLIAAGYVEAAADERTPEEIEADIEKELASMQYMDL